MKTAILIDGSFFLRRYNKLFHNGTPQPPEQVAKDLYTYAYKHLDNPQEQLYRIFYYDCPPLSKKTHLPVSKQALDFSKTEDYLFRTQLLDCLKHQRKLALRLGELRDGKRWILRPDVSHKLIQGKRAVNTLTDEDFTYDVRQKGVDAKIGVDIASLAYKKQVTQIVLIAGDSDFVPAAKLARREGIDFILDPMWGPINDDLFEHIDGLKTKVRRPQTQFTHDHDTN